MYGSSRLGIWEPDMLVSGGNPNTIWDQASRKQFELTNHLENMPATIGDYPSAEGKAVVYSAQDYYPFGMMMPDRHWADSGYRYGFNGKANDVETGFQDYGMRVYDGRIGKFLSVDPLMKSYPYYTPYQFAGDNPIKFIDLDGAEQYDPDSRPTGITHISVARVPEPVSKGRSIWFGNYEMKGFYGANGAGYWIARYHYKEGPYKGGYDDEWVVGPNGFNGIAKNPERYHNRSG